MAFYFEPGSKLVVSIPRTIKGDSFTLYEIHCAVENVWWSVKHRYSEFADLHEKLMQTHALPKDILPPKKIFGNQSPSFVNKRREELEMYLKNVLEFLQNVYPIELLEFLDFPNVEMEGILASLAEQLYTQGDFLLEAHVPFKTSPLRVSLED